MQLERIRLLNFRQHEDTELVLGAGLTGIIGPNGAGKTTLLEAIAWALYGSEAARGTRDTIRRRGAGARAQVKVELDFVLGAHRYRVQRTLNGAELFQDHDPAPVANSLQAVTERVVRLLGMNREEFFNTYFTGQKQLAVMAALRPTERAQFLSRVLGYDRLRTAQERLRERRVAIRARLQALESSLLPVEQLERVEAEAKDRLARTTEGEREATAVLVAAERRLAAATPVWQEAQRLREQMAALAADQRLAEHRVNAARETFQDLDRQLVEANEARTRLEALREQLTPLAELQRERQQLDELAEGYSRRRAAEAQLGEARDARERLLARMTRLPAADALEAAREKMDQLKGRVADLGDALEARHTTWVREQQDATTKRDNLRTQYQELKEQHDRITQAGPDGACPTCARPLGKEYANVLGVIEGQLQDVLFNGNYYKQRIEQLAQAPGDLRELELAREAADRALQEATREFGSLQAQAREAPTLRADLARLDGRLAELDEVLRLAPAGYDHERHQAVRARLAELEPVALMAERLRAAADRAEGLVGMAEAAERKLTEHETEVRAVRERLSGLGYSEEAFLAAEGEQREADQVRRQAELAVVRLKAEREAAETGLAAVGERRAERAALEVEARRTAADLSLHNELDRAFTELRTDLNLQLRPDLSELASGFLRDLTRGRYGEVELDEEYNATLIEAGEPKPVISGGEEDLANLALRLAISQMIADRAGQPLSLLVLDEIFGSLDDEHRSAVLELLRGLADRFPQVILITHVESVREGFDRVIRVDFDAEQGSARVRDEEAGTPDGLAA
jgi:DNA repair protein SbcC/Rad50